MLCKAVQSLHKIGVAHRDIKPENIILTHVPIGSCREFANWLILAGRPAVIRGG